MAIKTTDSKRQPYNPIGPLTQAQMLDLKRSQGPLYLPRTGPYPRVHECFHVFRPWKTGKTYPYMSTRQMFRRAPALFFV